MKEGHGKSSYRMLEANTKWVIYALKDPRDSQIRYIGFSKNLEKRFHGHIVSAQRNEQSYKANWIRSLLQLGLEPVIDILEHGSGPNWAEREKHHIALWRSVAKLTNATDGGEGVVGWKTTDQWRANLSKALKGRVHTKQQLELIRKAAIQRRKYDRTTPEAQNFFKVMQERGLNGHAARSLFRQYQKKGRPLTDLPTKEEINQRNRTYDRDCPEAQQFFKILLDGGVPIQKVRERFWYAMRHGTPLSELSVVAKRFAANYRPISGHNGS